ncbi:MAG: sulfite exporter TauE/SafE family protein [Pseudohongiella sp.]|uniref:sulfite exporter TauE/SafE family protein n=1 Tax=Pseudohongiella sp. TaxID=1979412 RepID=UPI00349FD8F0
MDIVVAVVLVFVGAFVQTAVGFGLAVIAAPVLFFINPDFVPAPVTVCALLLSLINAWAFRDGVSLQGLKSAVIGRIPGSLAGAGLLLMIDKDMLALWIGLTVLFAVGVSLSSLRWHPTPGRMMTAGFLSGFMGTSTSIGGPPMALLWQHQDLALIRANLAAFFVVSCLISLIILAPIGHFGLIHLWLSLPLLPATVLGYWVARKTMHRLPAQAIRGGSLALCAFSGLYAVFSALL